MTSVIKGFLLLLQALHSFYDFLFLFFFSSSVLFYWVNARYVSTRPALLQHDPHPLENLEWQRERERRRNLGKCARHWS